jgi:hypothetical protein
MIKSRKTVPQDAPQIAAWIEADENHRGLEAAETWVTPQEHTFRYMVEDESGPLFCVIGENVLRLSIQFAPNQKRRMARAVDEFSKVMAAGAKKMGYKELIFESVFYPLVRFLHRRGFRKSSEENILDLR